MDLLEFPDAAAWESWLAAHHADASEAWLRIAKRGSGIETVAIADALDVALCWGWIDGQRKSLDDLSFRQRYSPRRPRSAWSQVNVAKAAAAFAGLGRSEQYQVILTLLKTQTERGRTRAVARAITRLEG